VVSSASIFLFFTALDSSTKGWFALFTTFRILRGEFLVLTMKGWNRSGGRQRVDRRRRWYQDLFEGLENIAGLFGHVVVISGCTDFAQHSRGRHNGGLNNRATPAADLVLHVLKA